ARDASALVAELRDLPGVQAADLVPSAETAKRLVAALGSDQALLEGVDVATLPASVEVRLAPGVRDVVAMSPTVRALRGAPGVADVVVEEERRDHAGGALSAIRTIAWTALALFAGLALIVTLAAIRVRLDRDAARREIEVAQLLGAGPSFVVVPTALAGAIHGAVAALIATVLATIGVHVYGGAIAEALAPSFGSSPSALEVLAPAGPELALFVAIGAGVGLVGGLLAGASRVAR
ncbi:MAG: permease-like cell division protein FtsX, partial [Deltaproteobacteria bacterium]|nr:permease-like cell division protein FtsX [Deltaproteobacteria bacterium]